MFNQRKHGLSFEVAPHVFLDPLVVTTTKTPSEIFPNTRIGHRAGAA